MSESTNSEPYIWLQENELEGAADCGCVLQRDCYWGVDDSDGGGPAVVFCPLHAAAPDLLAACKVCDSAITELVEAEQSSSTTWVNIRAARHIVRAAIAKVEP